MNGLVLAGVCLFACAAVGVTGPPYAKARGHRIVFEFVGESAKQQQALLNNVENVLKALGAGTRILVVAHGDGLNLLLQPDSEIAARISKLASDTVSFAACENTMRRKKVQKEDLLPVAITVDSGVAEVVRRQEEGWSYVKSG